MRSLAALALLGAFVLAGCGAAETFDSEDVAAAAGKTAAAGSSRMDAVGESGDETVKLTGAIDYGRRRASLTYEVDSKGDRGGESGEMIAIGDTIYVDASLFGLAGEAGPAKPWLAIDLRETLDSLESFILPFPFIDPARTLDLLFKVSGEIEQAGEDDVRGVATEHYRLTIDLERVVEEAPVKYRTFLRRALEEETEKTMTLELWIDEEGLVRRLHVPELDKGTLTLDFYDFGVDVDVEAPPADQVVDELEQGWTQYAGPTEDEGTDDDGEEK